MSYITFSTLGESGGMCSQLQSYASLLAVAKANNKEIVFAKSMFDKPTEPEKNETDNGTD